MIGETDCPNVSVELITFSLYFCEVLISNAETVFSDRGSWCSSVPLWKCGHAGRAENWTTITSLHALSNSSVGKAISLLVGRTGVRIPAVRGFLFSETFRPTLGPTQPFIEWIPCFFFRGVKRPWLEVNHSPPSIVPRLGMSGDIPLLPLYAFMECVGRTLPLLTYLLHGAESFLRS